MNLQGLLFVGMKGTFHFVCSTKFMHSDDTAKRKFKRKRKGIGVLIFRQTQTSNSKEQTTYRIAAAVSENTVYRRTN